jgi:outer membrane protein
MTARVASWLCTLCSISILWAQQPSIEPIRPTSNLLVRPYQTPVIPPIRLANSGLLGRLMRAGNLYLTVQDAIALALDNNIDLEVARYNPLISAWQLERARAGGALPGVPSSASLAASVANGQGVAGSQAAAGVTVAGTGASASAGGNATVTQVGPVAQTLDPSIQESTVFTHKTTPEPDTVQSAIQVLVSNTRVYNASIQEGFLTGGSITASYSEHYLNENSPTDVLNPSEAPSLSISFQHNLLQGFGVAVNSRNIEVSKVNLKTSELNFKTQVIGTVVSVLQLYYGLVADYEDIRAKESAVEAAERLYEDSKKQEQVGSMARLDVATAEAQVASAQGDLVVSRTNLVQQEFQLKNLLSRTGVADPMLAAAHVIPLDRIVVPDQDEFPPLNEMIQQALITRSDLAAEKAGITTAEISARGTRNGVLPSLQVFGGESHAGLAGTPKVVTAQGFVETADPYFVGGMSQALGQIFRRDFPTERIGAFLSAPIGNRQAQADYGIDQLQLRQTQLTTQKDMNQAGVDVSNYLVALRQARVRYKAAQKNRVLQEQLLDAEQKKLPQGSTTQYNIIRQQQDLTAAQSGEIASLVAYSNARIALDQAMGTTLEANGVSIEAAKNSK